MYTYTRKVNYYETDKMGIVHHANYILWMEEARIALVDKLGFSYQKLEADQLISPVSRVRCTYKQSTTFAEIIDIKVRIAQLNGARCVFTYQMYREDTLVFEGSTEHYFLNPQGDLINIKREFPSFYRALARFQALKAAR